MIGDITWLATEAKSLHQIFSGMFYGLVLTFLLLGVVCEYFKWPLGSMPGFSQLVGRALVAALLLQAYPEIANTLASFVDAIAAEVGEFNNFKLVLSRMGDKLNQMSSSWVSVKESIALGISFVSFFALYFSVYIAEGITMFTWLLSYVFSPLLIALFVLPATAGATKALFRTLIEVSCWKIVWSVLATLLWSLALSEINKPEYDANLLSVVCLNLTLASSVLLTPWIVHALAESGLSGFTRTVGGMVVGSTMITPHKVASTTRAFTKKHIVSRFHHKKDLAGTSGSEADKHGSSSNKTETAGQKSKSSRKLSRNISKKNTTKKKLKGEKREV